jgi:formamidopyrimidine-DNA glycosylase
MSSVFKAFLNAKEITKLLSGKTIVKSLCDRRDVFEHHDDFCLELPKHVVGVGCHGRFIFILLDGGDSCLWLEDGSLNTLNSSPRSDASIVLSLQDGSSVVYQGPRSKGAIKCIKGRKKIREKLKSLGINILSDHFDTKNFEEFLIKKPKAKIAEALMDESIVCSINNLECSEILWRSKISPHKTIDAFCLEELEELRINISEYLEESKIDVNILQDIQITKIEKDPLGNKIKLDRFNKKNVWWSPNIQL